MTLRGAGVEVDARHVQRAVVGVGLVALSVAVVVLFLSAGSRRTPRSPACTKRASPSRSRCPVASASWGAAAAIWSATSAGGRSPSTATATTRRMPGTRSHSPGATLRAVSVPGDPALVVHASRLGGRAPVT